MEEIRVEHCTFNATLNGARIKTWQVKKLMFFLFHIYFVQYTIYLLSFSSTMQSAVQGGSGFARNILFRNITLINSYNPIIIDQYYFCRPGESCEKEVGRLKKMVLILDHKDYHPISAIGFSLTLVLIFCIC